MVKGVFTLIVGVHACLGATGASHRVNLIDEDDARRFILGLPEEVSHTRSTDANEHLDEVGTGHREERHVGLAGDCLGQQSLTRSRRPHEQSAFGNLTAQLGVVLGILEEVDNLGNLHFGLGQACNILEGHLVVVILVKEFRLGLADIEDATTATGATHATIHEEIEGDQQDDGTKGPEHHRIIARLVILNITLKGPGSFPLLGFFVKARGPGNLRGDPVGCHTSTEHGRPLRLRLLSDALSRFFSQFGLQVILVGVDRHRRHASFTDDFVELGPCHLLRDAAVVVQPEHRQEEQSHQSIHPEEVELGRLALVIVVSHNLFQSKSLSKPLPLIQVGNLVDACIGPELLQVVALAEVRDKDVHKDIAIVNNHPLCILVAVIIKGALPSILFHILPDTVGHCCHLHGGIARCYDKSLGCCRFDVGEIHMDDVTSFLFLNCLDNCLN